jgi:hypothetical protein
MDNTATLVWLHPITSQTSHIQYSNAERTLDYGKRKEPDNKILVCSCEPLWVGRERIQVPETDGFRFQSTHRDVGPGARAKFHEQYHYTDE